MRRDAPERFISTMSKAARRGKIFIDYLRNERGATAIAPYSTRARAGAPVSVPLDWNELPSLAVPNPFTVANLRRRLAAQKRDPWADMAGARQSLTARALRALGLKA
jgi:bifunctional non-homologous end joining protein LigD